MINSLGSLNNTFKYIHNEQINVQNIYSPIEMSRKMFYHSYFITSLEAMQIQSTFTCSKLTMETPEIYVKSVQS